jgi:hypothetical protein
VSQIRAIKRKIAKIDSELSDLASTDIEESDNDESKACRRKTVEACAAGYDVALSRIDDASRPLVAKTAVVNPVALRDHLKKRAGSDRAHLEAIPEEHPFFKVKQVPRLNEMKSPPAPLADPSASASSEPRLTSPPVLPIGASSCIIVDDV